MEETKRSVSFDLKSVPENPEKFLDNKYDNYKNTKCCIFGTVMNCGKYLDSVFENMECIGNLFEDYAIVVYYDRSMDNTITKLKEYSKRNLRFSFYTNTELMSPHRTHNIAKGRNYCLDQLRKKYSDFPYFIMMDCDDVCSTQMNIDVLRKWLCRYAEWDSLSFSRKPYYDIWALSIDDYMFSCFHFEPNYTEQLGRYITLKLNSCSSDKLISCYSAFNGFAIYKTEIFMNCEYDGKLTIDYLPIKDIIKKFGPISYKVYPHEDCEHRRFHYEAIQLHGARIRISSDQLFPHKPTSHVSKPNLNHIKPPIRLQLQMQPQLPPPPPVPTPTIQHKPKLNLTYIPNQNNILIRNIQLNQFNQLNQNVNVNMQRRYRQHKNK